MSRLDVGNDIHAHKMNKDSGLFECDCAIRLLFWESHKQAMYSLTWIL